MRKVEVKVIAEYWANIEINDEEEEPSEEELHEMAWREFYDEAHRASIEKVKIEDDRWECDECGEQDDYDNRDEHICEEGEEE